MAKPGRKKLAPPDFVVQNVARLLRNPLLNMTALAHCLHMGYHKLKAYRECPELITQDVYNKIAALAKWQKWE